MKLHIERYGNFGGDNPNDTYSGRGETKAAEGFVSLSDLGCGGFYSDDITLEIISVTSEKTELRIFGNRYTVTTETPLLIERKDIGHGDGGLFTEFDEITVCYKGE